MARRKFQAIAASFFLSIAAAAYAAQSLVARAADEKGARQGAAKIDGAKLFQRECSRCHGEDGRGRMLKQPDFTAAEWQNKITDERMFRVIKWGREPMPFYAGALTDEQIRAVVGYIRSLAASDASSLDQSFSSRADNCAACHRKRDARLIEFYSSSTRSRARVNCDSCHGGDSSKESKEEAHGSRLIGQTAPTQSLAMCGSCHSAQLAEFKTSRHFPEQRGVPRLDCAQCHGIHRVGAAGRNFSFAYYCSGCHGLEYLPELPREFQKMLALTDDLNDEMRGLQASGRAPTAEILSRRKAIRREIGEIVHPTDVKGGVERIPKILELGEALKQIIEREKK